MKRVIIYVTFFLQIHIIYDVLKSPCRNCFFLRHAIYIMIHVRPKAKAQMDVRGNQWQTLYRIVWRYAYNIYCGSNVVADLTSVESKMYYTETAWQFIQYKTIMLFIYFYILKNITLFTYTFYEFRHYYYWQWKNN